MPDKLQHLGLLIFFFFLLLLPDGEDSTIVVFDWHGMNWYNKGWGNLVIRYDTSTNDEAQERTGKWAYDDQNPLSLRSYICEAEPQNSKCYFPHVPAKKNALGQPCILLGQ